MADYPILFSAPMVRALLAGTKTQTRRVVKPEHFHGSVMPPDSALRRALEFGARCPFGEPGDRLWVRETWGRADDEFGCEHVVYAADSASFLVGARDDGAAAIDLIDAALARAKGEK